MQRALLEDVLNCFQLTTFAIMISLIYAFSPEILSQDAMACAKLKQLACAKGNLKSHGLLIIVCTITDEPL